jgi:hypothetical protein
MTTNEINKTVRSLNAHHMRYMAGFYAQGIGGLNRFFRARRHKGRLQVYDFDVWYDVPEGTTFYDHNGQDL